MMEQAQENKKRWWVNDPHINNQGFGAVLHQKNGKWSVAKVLKKSPAETAGMLAGDTLMMVDTYDLNEPISDIHEALLPFRGSTPRLAALPLVVERKSSNESLHLKVATKPLHEILEAHLHVVSADGEEEDGSGLCNTCRSCRPVTMGWAECGANTRCQNHCMIA